MGIRGEKGRQAMLVGECEPPEPDEEQEVCSRWVRDRRQSEDTAGYLLPLLQG